MAITKSAKKAIRQSERRRQRNLVYKNKIKQLRKEIVSLVQNKKIDESLKILPLFYKIVDKAAKKGVIKSNKAARLKSRITKLINKNQSS